MGSQALSTVALRTWAGELRPMECPPPSPDISLVALTVTAAHIPRIRVRSCSPVRKGQVQGPAGWRYKGMAAALGSRQVVGREAGSVGWGLKMPVEGSVPPRGQDSIWVC